MRCLGVDLEGCFRKARALDNVDKKKFYILAQTNFVLIMFFYFCELNE